MIKPPKKLIPSPTPTPTNGDGTQKLRANERRWTPELMRSGWTAVPSVIMEYQRELGLSPALFNVLMQLAKYWWKDTDPFVAKATIARAMNISPRHLQRHLSALEQAGLIEREARYRPDGSQTSNSYSFKGLIERAKPYAAKMSADRAERSRRATPSRKPGLRLGKK